MGLFSKKKKIFTSSSVYNLAGDVNKRPNVLKTTVLSQAINHTYPSFGESITGTYLNGQGMRFRSFSRWVDRVGYRDLVGMVSPKLTYVSRSSTAMFEIASEIKEIENTDLHIKNVDIGFGEIEWWGDSFVSENRPDLIGKNYLVDIDEEGDLAQIEVYLEGDETYETPIEVVTFFPLGYNPDSEYLYVSYVRVGERVRGTPTITYDEYLENESDFSDTSGREVLVTLPLPEEIEAYSYIENTYTYSDSRPPLVEVTNKVYKFTYIEVDTKEYVLKTPLASDFGQLVENIDSIIQITTENVSLVSSAPTTTTQVVDGVTITKTSITYTPIRGEISYREIREEREDLAKEWGAPKLFFYEKNTGNAYLDTLFGSSQNTGEYFPVMPIKYGSFISDVYLPNIYEKNIKGFKKFSGDRKSYGKILKSIKENPDIGDIKYVYTMFGASINTQDNSAKRYIFDFFNSFYMENQNTSDNLNAYLASISAIETRTLEWKTWFDAQKNINSPLYGKPEPSLIPYPVAPKYSFSLRNAYNFNYSLSWNSVEVVDGVGQIIAGSKMGRVYIERGVDIVINTPTLDQELGYSQDVVTTITGITISLQTSNDTWRKITVRGLSSFNLIYKGKGEYLDGVAELLRREESALIIPLNDTAFKSMGLIKGTQFTTANTYLIFNTYKVVKQKWYQTTLFKIILVIVIIVVTVFTAGAGGGLAAGGGVLGGNAAVGAAVGFAAGTTAAALAGAVLNAIAAMVIAGIITKVATALFGAKIGAIVGAIASIVVLNVGTNVAAGQGWTVNYNELTKSVNLLKLTDSVSQAFIADINAQTALISKETRAFVAEYEKESQRIEDLYALTFGAGTEIDIKAIVEISSQFAYKKESADAFLSRTLMTGTDIAQLSHDMVTKFANITTSLHLE